MKSNEIRSNKPTIGNGWRGDLLGLLVEACWHSTFDTWLLVFINFRIHLWPIISLVYGLKYFIKFCVIKNLCYYWVILMYSSCSWLMQMNQYTIFDRILISNFSNKLCCIQHLVIKFQIWYIGTKDNLICSFVVLSWYQNFLYQSSIRVWFHHQIHQTMVLLTNHIFVVAQQLKCESCSDGSNGGVTAGMILGSPGIWAWCSVL